MRPWWTRNVAIRPRNRSVSIRMPDLPRFVLFARLRPRNPARPTVFDRRKIGYPSPGAAIPDAPVPLFADGFEAGDTDAW